ncbi:MAG: hypothetical protein A3H69_04690 [Candidatus Sungbacteria bacterium RIFCSPLOWO2_02_FULL_47_9]|uniref:ATP synthase F(0) sector subunit c n=1 Tax=Candidatus Sungbacteria bacterium RIFCSPHIGHO2_01_FULL_47_32 TaxID=1802264 RepID=A0A1G2K4S1_9BACT|nr:MAG: ATPase, F0/V0 complex, subunit C [Parcubacteria group bacterium GW2011_GWA2_47_10]OGZ93490.1 MAG: hypothetical protein A2633_06400 [Candidatus Sungbacteria bacterium RIFCSPHIGHO2_01_FULL_47_32]OGZ97947.1 MAG: hypothetical protein A3D57_04975 [Candidatus Sungbacteria bacterium RIFCSPHIGHO2_02_FULL_46_12]OHA04389.1 MAG: hypothetical protein A3A28_03650 [Candidatus Sungbacteria bacterium RIFCSPLOWO2_01_FULL_47_32]OHA11894.1 MAG: hypothetical protein A3H69_04690 [Candidatus Sungbacteria bac
MSPESIPSIVSGLTIAIGVMLPALAIGMIGKEAVRSIARNPEAGERIQLTALVLVAFAEALGIYTLVVALVIKFVQ